MVHAKTRRREEESDCAFGAKKSNRHCEPTGIAFGDPEDKLREAIQKATNSVFDAFWIASSLTLLAMASLFMGFHTADA
ncbi:MAG: hypothetical protein Q7V31_10945 [Parvibaculum sp.]|uniref:hypothetical protein n=1 Tax=Parvibaculum sp. TaxID=2024848 RepID=UPI00272020B3|nr:hypothetical protein [Parvibaculum sp.]MDO8839435.1 hypothetical protein [Parvibaculum sp.]